MQQSQRMLLIIVSCILSGCVRLVSPPEVTVHVPPAESHVSPNWHLIWADEFDYSGLPDFVKWGYEEGFVRNQELQYFTKARPENARIQKGMLIIEARKERYLHARYTSASLTTWNKSNFLYGRIEIRAKLPTGRGTWPAFFTLGRNIDRVGWPACGEIDIMENVGYQPDRIYANIHTIKYNHVLGTSKGSSIIIPGISEDFHLYAIEWFKNRIDFFVDEVKYFEYHKIGDNDRIWPFDKAQYLLINLAVGGSWGGRKGVDDSIFPQKIYIDFVRVYENKIAD